MHGSITKMKRFYLFCIFGLFAALLFSQQKVTPQKGEGIHALLRRYNRGEAIYYEEFIRLNKKKLGKSNALVSGNTYRLPPLRTAARPERKTSNRNTQTDTLFLSAVNTPTDTLILSGANNNKTGTQSLFGEKYKKYEIIDNRLAGACFFLVSGHGGPDPGAIAKVDGYKLHEDEYAYDIMLRLARNLLQHNATVHIIIQDAKDGIRDDKYLNNSNNETCMGEEISSSQVARLKQQTNKINSLSFSAKEKYQRAIFIHLDSRSYKKQLDVFFYHQNGKSNKTRSLRLAETMQKTFRSNYEKHQPGRGFSGTVSTRPLYVLKNTTPVSILVELANMQNVNDQRRYVLENNRQALANWLCEGFMKDYQSNSR